MTLKVINPSLGRRRTFWRYFSMIIGLALFVAMISNRGSSAHQRTLFQRLDIPVEGYIVAIIVCLVFVVYGVLTAFRDDFKDGELSIQKEGITLRKGKKLETFTYEQIDSIQLGLCYKNSVTDEGGQHWEISLKVDGSTRHLDIIVPKNEIDELISWRDLHSHDK